MPALPPCMSNVSLIVHISDRQSSVHSDREGDTTGDSPVISTTNHYSEPACHIMGTSSNCGMVSHTISIL